MPLLAVFHWDTDPVLVDLGFFSLRWYGVLFAAGFLASFSLVRRIFAREGKPDPDVDSLLVHTVVATIVGARLAHCLVYEPRHYLAHPVEILKFWEGGLASHGGIAGIAIALWFYCRRRPDQPYLWLVDRLALPAALTGSMIRLGNFFNSEIVGVPTDVSWAVVFERVDPRPRHPAQLYESVAYAVTFVVVWLLYRRFGERTPRGLLFGLMFLLIFSARIAVESVKERQAAYEQGMAISVGTWLSIVPVLIGLVLTVRALKAGRTA